MLKYQFDVFADWFHFHLEDEGVEVPEDFWNENATRNRIAIAPGAIGIGTGRNMTVPVTFEIFDSQSLPHEHKDDTESADHVVECSITIDTGRLVVWGGSDYYPDSPRIELTPGTYRARIYHTSLTTISEDGLEGDDEYRIVLYPGSPIEPGVIKRYEG